MKIHFKVTIQAGKRTESDVNIYGTSVNEKTLILKNGRTVTEQQLVDFIYQSLMTELNRLEDGE